MMFRTKLICLFNEQTLAFLSGAVRSTSCRYYGTKIGNSRYFNINESAYLPEDWMKEWFLSMKRKSEIEGPDTPSPRSNQRNWNYKAELSAFQTRLGLKCPEKLLHIAFCDGLTSKDDENSDVADESITIGNSELSAAGKNFSQTFVTHYVNIALPALPAEGRQSVENYLLDSSNLACLTNNLGHRDLLQTNTFPPSDDVLAECFLAVLQVINMSEGPVAAARFLLDFVVPCLHGKDILDDIWKPNDPMALLTEEMKKKEKPLPEARLSKQCGVNTVLPLFYVALFSGDEFLVESGGESASLAESDAAKLTLKHLYTIHPNAAPLPMGMNVDNKFLKILFEPLLASYKNAFDFVANDATAD